MSLEIESVETEVGVEGGLRAVSRGARESSGLGVGSGHGRPAEDGRLCGMY